jgi:hypothetical protein
VKRARADGEGELTDPEHSPMAVPVLTSEGERAIDWTVGTSIDAKLAHT